MDCVSGVVFPIPVATGSSALVICQLKQTYCPQDALVNNKHHVLDRDLCEMRSVWTLLRSMGSVCVGLASRASLAPTSWISLRQPWSRRIEISGRGPAEAAVDAARNLSGGVEA